MLDIEKVRKFVESQKQRFDLDRQAIREARIQANGDAWRNSFSTVKSTLKHKVRVDAINQIINKICSKFTSNPFRFLATSPESKDIQLDYGSFDTCIAAAFRDSVVTGQGFIYVDYSAGKARRLDAGSVIMDSSMNSPYVICVDKEPIPEKINRKADNLGIGENTIEYHPDTERLVFVVYRKIESGILVAKVAGGVIESEEILPISEYPVIRIVAEESWISEKKTFRGLYHKAQGVSDLIDAAFSRIIGNIMTQPRMKYWVASSLAGSDAFAKQMAEMHRQDTAYAVYDAYDDQQRAIPPPVRDEARIFVDELVSITDKMIGYINMLFGFENAENSDTGNKTAQEILFRKENQNANYSQYLFNLSVSMQSVCKIYESCGYGKVSIVSGPYENIYRQTSMQQIIALNDYCTANPSRAAIAPLLIKYSSLDEIAKSELENVIAQQIDLQQIISQSQQAQQELQNIQGQNQQLMQTVQALQTQQLNSDKSISADLRKEQMRLADKEEDRNFKAIEAEKDRAVELYKIELNSPESPSLAPPPEVMAATDLNPLS